VEVQKVVAGKTTALVLGVTFGVAAAAAVTGLALR